MVEKLLIQGDSCYGVLIEINGSKAVYLASKEVIVSCGAIGSPQLLLLSGIGPKEHLEKVSIPVVKDLPVGKNLHDHVGVIMPVKESCTQAYVSNLNATSFTYLLRVKNHIISIVLPAEFWTINWNPSRRYGIF